MIESRSNPDPIDLAVGRRILVRRKQIGMSQAELAEHLGVSFQQVQKYERAANRVSASMLVRVARRLGTTVGWLVGEGDGPTEEAVFDKLAAPGAVTLLDAYAQVRSPEARAAILSFVVATSRF